MADVAGSPVLLFLTLSKQGTSVFRETLSEASRRSSPPYYCATWDAAPADMAHCAVVQGRWLGGCAMPQLRERPCSYVTLVREPISRILSAWRYFCFECQENLFCRNKTTLSCPDVDVVAWARFENNVLTRRFGVLRPSRYDFNRVRTSWRGFLDERIGSGDVARAAAVLSAPNVTVLWTDELSTRAAPTIAALLGSASTTGRAVATVRFPDH